MFSPGREEEEIPTDDWIDGDMGNVKPYHSTEEGLQINILPRNHTFIRFEIVI